MSGIFGSTTIKGTRITDFSSTSAEVGKAIPFGHGSYPVDGFIGWAPLPPTEHRQVKRQGKGGVKQETFTYTLPYAVMFCKGPTFGWRWIKRNGKVVYTTDPNAPLEDKAYAAKWAQRVNFYNGSLDQLPDSLIESHEGVGNVSAFHGMTYFTVEDEDVTDTGGAPPNYEGVVIATPPEAYLTSKPYPAFFTASVNVGASVPAIKLKTELALSYTEPQELGVGASVTSIVMREPLRSMLTHLQELGVGASIPSITMRQPLEFAITERQELGVGASVPTITLTTGLVRSITERQELGVGASVPTITLTTP